MYKIFIALLSLTLISCKDAIPQVSMLDQGSKGNPVVQSPVYADTNLAASTTVQSGDHYTARVLIHSGTALSQRTSADGYKLEVRHLSF